MATQTIYLKGMLTENPIFTETIDGKNYAEIKFKQVFKNVDKDKNTFETSILFNCYFLDNLSDLENYEEKDLVEIVGDYRQFISGNEISHEVFVNSIRKIDEKEKQATQIEVLGNLTSDAELKESYKGNAYIKTSIATNSKFIDKKDQETEITTFYNLLHVSENAEDSTTFKKGDFLKVKGRLQIQLYKSKDGKLKTNNTIFVSEISRDLYDAERLLTQDELKKF